jgi:hypothetical protein
MIRNTILSLAAVSMIGVIGGCKATPSGPQTEGDRTVLEGKLQQEQGAMMRDGEKTVAKGQGMKAEGEAMRKQGKTVEGDRMVRDGELLITQGNAKIDQAKKMKTEVAPVQLETREGTRATTQDTDRDTTENK